MRSIFLLLLLVSLLPIEKVVASSLSTENQSSGIAVSDHSYSSYLLGLRYDFGVGAEQDYAKAADQYRSSGHPFASKMLAYLYNAGEGVDLEFRKANHYYSANDSDDRGSDYLPILKAASKRDMPKANYLLGRALILDEVIERDCDKAIKLLSRAANQGYSFAQYTLGYLYGGSLDCGYVDIEKQLYWYIKAANDGLPQAMNNLSNYYAINAENRNLEVSIDWLKKAAQIGVMAAQNRLGMIYYQGEELGRDLHEAIKWWEESVAQNNSTGKYYLGALLLNGEGEIGRNVKRALALLHEAANEEECGAQYALSQHLLFKEQAIGEAMRWFEKAMENKCDDWNNLRPHFSNAR